MTQMALLLECHLEENVNFSTKMTVAWQVHNPGNRYQIVKKLYYVQFQRTHQVALFEVFEVYQKELCTSVLCGFVSQKKSVSMNLRPAPNVTVFILFTLHAAVLQEVFLVFFPRKCKYEKKKYKG